MAISLVTEPKRQQSFGAPSTVAEAAACKHMIGAPTKPLRPTPFFPLFRPFFQLGEDYT